MNLSNRPHLPFSLVLAGGGARGFAHVGVLHALAEDGIVPSALVGVSMGAVVAATYSARDDWYARLLAMDTGGFPSPAHDGDHRDRAGRLTQVARYVHTAWNMITSWGAPPPSIVAGRQVLDSLIGRHRLEESRLPIAICATDLISGERVILREGSAAEAVYASAALAGVIPPLARNGLLLADGAYTDVAPIDVARAFGHPVVVVVDPSQPTEVARVENGLQAIMRAMEICHLRHAALRMRQADLVVRPEFPRAIDVLDFASRHTCVTAGVEAVVRARVAIHDLLEVDHRARTEGRS